MNSFILTFRSTHDAMEEEEILAKSEFSYKMIPTPRGISSECGFSIRINTDVLAIVGKLCNGPNTIERIYLQYAKDRSKQYEEIYRR